MIDMVPEDGNGPGGRSRVVPSISVRADSVGSTADVVVGDAGGRLGDVSSASSVVESSVGTTADGEVVVVEGGGGGISRVVSSISVRADSVGSTADVEVVVVGDAGGRLEDVSSISIVVDSPVGTTADGEVVDSDGAFSTSMMWDDVTVKALTGTWTVGWPSPFWSVKQSVM